VIKFGLMIKFGLKPKPLSTPTNQNCKQIKMALIAAGVALLTNNRHANYRREPNIRREGCISSESDRRTDEYTRWRSGIDMSCLV